MAKNSIFIWVIVAIVAVVIYNSGFLQNLGNNNPGSNDQGGSTYISTGSSTVTIAGSDALAAGTAVSGTTSVSNNGGTFVTDDFSISASPDNVLDVLIINGTSYHNAILEDYKVPKAPTDSKSIQLYKNATVTENMYTTTGLVITNGGGAQNQTDLGNGASYNLKDEMTAAALSSTNDMVCIIEITAGTNASTTPAGATLALNGAQITSAGTAKPTWYSTAGTNSNVYLFEVPAMKTSATQTLTIGLNAKSTGRFSATSYIKKSCYTKEYFIDPNTGKLTYDVADSNGVVKSMATYIYTAYFQ